MILRKINAVLSLLTTFLLLDHAIFFSLWMLSRCSIEKSVDAMPWILAILMGIHAVISILILLFSQKGKEKRKYNKYAKMNLPTLVQRVSGILMLLLLVLHIVGSSNHFQPKLLHAILHPIFFTSALAHTSVSASKALITLGIGNTKVVRVVDVIMKVICGVLLVAGVAGFYICLFMGVAR